MSGKYDRLSQNNYAIVSSFNALSQSIDFTNTTEYNGDEHKNNSRFGLDSKIM